jgi:hypothetical protein
VPIERLRFGQTRRRDRWWAKPLIVFVILTGFIVYATFRVFENAHYELGGYLSPLYSPLLFGTSDHAWFGPLPSSWPGLLSSPALFILWAPAGFRLTCYYYRGTYYKAFWADPPACAVGEPRKSYLGEQKLPLILQNLHRFFLYLALLFLVFLSIDVWNALWFDVDGKPGGPKELGLGLGTLVLALNVVLLGGYTLGCHSLRHLVGGGLRRLAEKKVRKKTYDCVSCLNRGHAKWAWASLFGVVFADLYVRMCASGAWTDWRII